MEPRSAVLTYRDYAALPDDGRRYELHDGALSVTPAPGTRHQRISRDLFEVLNAHVKARRLGEVLYAPLDVILSDTTVLQPDIVYFDHSRLAALSGRGAEGAPTLVVEIISPSTTTIDRVTKPRLYARHRVPFFWLVDPEARSLEAFALGPEGYSLVVRASGVTPVGPPPFPDLALIPASLWP
ncbi:MAG TPA: Uma2 family endonuclease [Methylomirabilota bacterium]|jgi:Uma2 family endonuclease|nr:Uma2 family endonuclease [Methylomirabilota bacterium]